MLNRYTMHTSTYYHRYNVKYNLVPGIDYSSSSRRLTTSGEPRLCHAAALLLCYTTGAELKAVGDAGYVVDVVYS